MISYHQKQSRPLTFDERQAAEAAFAGQPPSAAWSEAGRRVYEGLVAVLSSRMAERPSHDRRLVWSAKSDKSEWPY